jgi:hypothetical protein
VDPEASSKKRRGRPKSFSDEWLERALASGVSSARYVKTTRGAQDVAYRILAFGVIEQFRKLYPAEAEPLEWLFKPGDMRGETWRHSLLTEIGRARHPQWIVPIATRIAQMQPSTKEGIRLIRLMRQRLEEHAPRPDEPQRNG